MFGKRGYDFNPSSGDGDFVHHDKRKLEVATDSDDGIEAINVERYALNADDAGRGSHESLRAAIAAGIRKKKKKYDCRDYVKGWLSLHGLMICKVLLFLLLLTATIIVTALSVRASQLRTEEEAEAYFNSTLLVKGNTVIAYTSCGPVQGWVEDGAYAFRGIPYALPPEGERRWKPPVPLHRLEYCWNDTLVTHTREDPLISCWQTYRNGSLDGSEDCLTVDVYAPKTNRSGPKVPVVVLVAAETLGGGGGRGFESPQLLNPKLAKATSMIFVQVRFRLGILGFFTASPLTKSVYPPRSGNYGLADVRAALEWVKLNAGSFGGDPSSITVLGHRAGATLVLALTTVRKPLRLFSGVWLSGPTPLLTQDNESARRDWLNAQKQGDKLINDLECSPEWPDIQDPTNISICLRDIDAEDLMDTMPEDWKWRPVDLPTQDEDPDLFHKWLTVDGDVLRMLPLTAWELNGVQVPMVIGTTSLGESTAELIQRQNWSAQGAVKKHIQESSIGAAGLTSEALHLYTTASSKTIHTTNSTPLALLTAMITDIRSICPLISMARFASRRTKRYPLYFYISESHPREGGGHIGSDTGGNIVSPTIGPGSDLLEILTHPLSKSRENYGALAQMFYTFVEHAPKQQVPSDPPWMKTSNMSPKLILTSLDGQVMTTGYYSKCEFWERKGFVSSKFAWSD